MHREIVRVKMQRTRELALAHHHLLHVGDRLDGDLHTQVPTRHLNTNTSHLKEIKKDHTK